MLNPSVFIGEPLYFTNKIKIYPPRVKDVVGNPSYSILFKILTTSTEDLTEELQTETVPSPFEFLLANCYHDKRFSELVQFAFLFFCRVDVEFLFESKEILVKSEEGDSYIQESDFFDF
jgi:hypothetical protein